MYGIHVNKRLPGVPACGQSCQALMGQVNKPGSGGLRLWLSVYKDCTPPVLASVGPFKVTIPLCASL